MEFVLGAVQAVYRRFGEENPEYRSLPQTLLVPWLDAMGQRLFEPPNVKGWPGGPSWLNTSTVLSRDNFAGALATGTLWFSPTPDPTATPATVRSTVSQFVNRLTHRSAPVDMPEEPGAGARVRCGPVDD